MFNDGLGIFAHDANIEQHQLEQTGNRISRLKKKGICLHGHINTKTLVCLEPNCGKTWDSEQQMFDEIEDLRIEYGI